jgi:hypothetical protein
MRARGLQQGRNRTFVGRVPPPGGFCSFGRLVVVQWRHRAAMSAQKPDGAASLPVSSIQHRAIRKWLKSRIVPGGSATSRRKYGGGGVKHRRPNIESRTLKWGNAGASSKSVFRVQRWFFDVFPCQNPALGIGLLTLIKAN